MAELNLELITPEKVILKTGVDTVTVPGSAGSFQILKNHAPLISTFETGIITVKSNGSIFRFTTSGGTVEVNNNEVLVLAETAEKIESIDLNRAELAKKRAEERLSKKHETKIDEARAEAALKRAINRISAVRKYS